MAGDPEPIQERRRRLAEVRAEIDRELSAGNTLSTEEWLKRYPELEPELGVMLRGLIGSGPTQEARPLDEGRPGGEETIDGGSMAPPEALPTVMIPSESRPDHAEVEATQAATQAVEAAPTVVDHGQFIQETALLDPLAETAPIPPTPAPNRLPPGQKVRYIGDYETTSILGQGGMGVVYKARQLSLNRLVALKMIRNAEFAGDEQVRRFQNEAEAVATLDHPGIVPIYEVGTFEDQRYFSMKLVDGGGMDKRLKDLAKDPKRGARIVAEVADAVHHAHQRGILHRDLKPANILLDHDDHAHVTDFGLAKKIDEDAGLTVTGAIMGTPSYMSPEQAAGRTSAVTTSSDVYGLGAILYAALTGRAPFASDSVLNTLDQVRNSPPQPPTRLNAKLPRDLEVICLKCLEKESRHRYPSAQALHDDLHRYLRGEPIAARPVGPAVRLAMWAKRKPALAGLSAALILGTIIGTVAVFVQWREAVAQRDKAEIARNDAIREEKAARKAEGEAKVSRDAAVASEKVAVEARKEAEKNFQLASVQATKAIETVQLIIDQVQRDLSGPGLFEFKAKILKVALEKVDGVAKEFSLTTNKEATTAAVQFELGRIYRNLGQTEKAFQAFQKSMEVYKERVKIKNGSDPSRRNLAMSYLQLAGVSEEFRRDMKAALAYREDHLKLIEDIYLHPKYDGFALDRKFVRETLAEAYGNVALSHRELGNVKLALEYLLKANNVGRQLVEDFPDNPWYKQQVSFSTLGMAEMYFRLGDRPLAERYYKETLDLREATFQLKPGDRVVLHDLSAIHYMIGEFRLRTSDLIDARRNLERSRDERTTLVDREAGDVPAKRALGLSYSRLGNVADLEKNADAAKANYGSALKIAETLWNQDPDNTKRQVEFMLALARSGETKRAVDIADRLSAGPDVDRELRIFLARGYAQVAKTTPPANAEAVQSALVNSVRQIRMAVDEGYRDRVDVETEPDLEPLRDREDFKEALAKIKPN